VLLPIAKIQVNLAFQTSCDPIILFTCSNLIRPLKNLKFGQIFTPTGDFGGALSTTFRPPSLNLFCAISLMAKIWPKFTY
jgi:hypothetical protein